jgi:hypothetical protein
MDKSGTFLTEGPDVGSLSKSTGLISAKQHNDEILNPNSEHVSQSTRLHHKMREMKEMDDRLCTMKEDYARRMALAKQGEARFLEKQKNMIDYLRKFKTFIIETDTKRSRAEKKEADERRLKEAKAKEIEELTAHLAALKKKRDDLLRKYGTLPRLCSRLLFMRIIN